MVKADTSSDPSWVFINWLYPGQHKFTAVKDVKEIERRIKMKGLRGWYASSEREHTMMHQTILPKMGATKYGEDAKNFYFKREVM